MGQQSHPLAKIFRNHHNRRDPQGPAWKRPRAAQGLPPPAITQPQLLHLRGVPVLPRVHVPRERRPKAARLHSRPGEKPAIQRERELFARGLPRAGPDLHGHRQRKYPPSFNPQKFTTSWRTSSSWTRPSAASPPPFPSGSWWPRPETKTWSRKCSNTRTKLSTRRSSGRSPSAWRWSNSPASRRRTAPSTSFSSTRTRSSGTKLLLISRAGGCYTIGMAYVGTSNNSAVKKLLNYAVNDVSDDVRRAAVISLAFVMFKQYEQLPKIMRLLALSYNPHVRYGTALALGIGCAGTGFAEALNMLEPMLNDSVDYVRQAAYIGISMVLQQFTQQMEPRVRVGGLMAGRKVQEDARGGLE